MIDDKLPPVIKVQKHKGNSGGLYQLLRHHPRWWTMYDVVIAILALRVVELGYEHQALLTFSFIEYVCFPVFFLMAAGIAGLYEKNAFNSFIKLFLSLFVAIILAVIGLILLKNTILYEQIGRYVIISIFLTVLIGCGFARLVFGSYIRNLALRVLFVGDEQQFLDFKNYFAPGVKYYALIGYCNESLKTDDWKLGDIKDIEELCKYHQIDLVVVDDYINRYDVFSRCLNIVNLSYIIIDKEAFIEQSFEQIAVDRVDPIWFYRANLRVCNKFQWTIKRGVDIFFAIVGLLFTLLLYPFICLAVKLDSRGPLLYSQIRCGRFDKEFSIYKFRTMRVDAETNGAVWAKQNDERVTRTGKFLRKTRLDELPQFWNILIGDMSFVGPRPERPELVKQIERRVPYFCFRQLLKPGITGLAQIKYRYGDSIEDAKEKLKYDLYYIKNWSFFMDMQIILLTIVKLMKGAR